MNKFKRFRVQPIDVPEARVLTYTHFGLDEGLFRNLPSGSLPPGGSPQLDSVRFDRRSRGVTRDYGFTTLGTAPPQAVIGLFEQDFNGLRRLFRVWLGDVGGGQRRYNVDVWNGVSSWSVAATSGNFTGLTEHSLASIVPIQGIVAITSGTKIQALTSPSTIGDLSADAPSARFLASFGDRLLALRSGGDAQALAWSDDGVLTDWTGGSSGEIFLVDVHSDVVDPLMSAVQLGANSTALFRARSIWRVFETGNVAQAVAAVPWHEGLGTEAPFSVASTPIGAIFLGSDMMVYILTASGERIPVGHPILGELLDTVSGAQIHVSEFTYGSYDPYSGEYWLSFGVEGSLLARPIYIFDVTRFIAERKIVWKRRGNPINGGIGVSDTVAMKKGPTLRSVGNADFPDGMIFSRSTRDVVVVDPNASVGTPFWTSDNLIRQDKNIPPGLYELVALTLYYQANSATDIEVVFDVDTDTTSLATGQTVSLESTLFLGSLGRKAITFAPSSPISGSDIRFTLLFPNTAKVNIIGYQPHLVRRAGLEYRIQFSS